MIESMHNHGTIVRGELIILYREEHAYAVSHKRVTHFHDVHSIFLATVPSLVDTIKGRMSGKCKTRRH